MTIQRELLDALLKEDETLPGYPGRRSMTTMAILQKKSFSTPDEVRTPVLATWDIRSQNR